MAKCSLIIDVIVGELTVLKSSPVAQHVKEPICPIVGVQITKGPLLCIHFLTTESIKNHLQYISNGNQFLPLEVEESYRNGGKFIFHRGKSCLYKIPQESEQKSSSVNNDVISSQNVVVIIMNALTYPPALFGKCTLQLKSQGETDGHMAGKVELRNHIGNLVGHLTISISLRYLGDVTSHTLKHYYNKDQDTVSKNFSDFVSDDKRNQSLMEMNEISGEHHKFDKNIHIMNNVSTNQFLGANTYGFEHSFNCSKSLDNALKDSVVQRESSEEIALKIAALVRSETSQEEKVSGENANGSGKKSVNCNQPDPILYYGHDSESEKIWNEKMKDLGGFFETIGNLDNCYDVKQNVSSCSENVEMYSSDETSLHSSLESEQTDERKSAEKLYVKGSVKKSSSDNHERKIEPIRCQTLKTPKGWLRSTPVASCSIHNKAVYPRLTRTSLLRKAKLDPELAYQLRAEVSYRVKQKLQSLEKNFKDELTDIKKRKLMKNKGSLLVSVGCQASSASNEKITSLNVNGQKDFAQQTVVFETSNQFTQINKDASKNNDLKDNVEKRKLTKLEKNRTFDISEYNQSHPTEYDDDFEVSSNSNPDPGTVSEFPVDHDNSKIGRSPRSTESKELSHFMSSKSEPKKHIKAKKGTNIMRDTKMKSSKSDIQEVSSKKSSVKSDCQFLDAKNEELMSNSIISERSESIIGGTVIKSKNSSSSQSISEVDVYSSSSILSPEVSEVSEVSLLSKEVYQELMKGRKADVLLRNGSQGFRKRSDTSISEGAVSRENLSVSIEENVQQSESGDIKSMKAKFVAAGETFSIAEVINSDDDMYASPKESSKTSEDLKVRYMRSLYKESKVRELQKTYTKSEPSFLDKPDEILSSPRNMPRISKSPSSKEIEDEDSTVSNISARIAALLVPKQLKVAALHTDSISSYMPSSVSDTLSSLSDLE
ncbi:uncharacterized protein [Palaemon carinicauda]|uniref:uncharacterized protein n=1 Tax=Palaemon carinicauda TaxID=392227 RepID=UPI0035B6764E